MNPRARLGRFALCLAATIEMWCERARQRGLLARMTERALKDIGLSRCDALREREKPFWRP